MKRNTLIKALIAIAVIAAIFFIVRTRDDDTELTTYFSAEEISPYEESYRAYLADNGYQGQLSSAVIDISLKDYVADKEVMAEFIDEGLATSDEGSVTFPFTVTEPGFYNLKVNYMPLVGTTSEIQRSISIDGQSSYKALEQIVFKRKYWDEKIKVKNNNEIRPSSFEIYEDTEVFVEDYGRRNGEPLIFYLSAGEHIITFSSVKEPVIFNSISFEAKAPLVSYNEKIAELKSLYPVYTGETLIGQAERTEGITKSITKSSNSISINKNYSDANLEPYHPYHIVYNTIGGSSYKSSGDFIEWELEAPESGLYSITLKGRQAVKRGVTSYRRIYVNGSVPYKELNTYTFNYTPDMVHYTISDESGEPYLFYLNKGSNTLKMEVVLGDFGKILTNVEESMFELNRLYLKTTQLTGTVPSKYIDYEIRKKLPGFVDVLSEQSAKLLAAENEIIRLTGEKGEQTVLLEKMIIEAAGLCEDPESVVEELSRWKDNIAALGTWTVNISEMPLEIDYIMLGSEAPSLPEVNAGFFKSLYYGVYRFVSSFFVKTNEVSSSFEGESEKALKVWMVSSGKEQAQILQNMIDESFTPNHDISVKLQLIPLSVVLRAALSGNSPDVLVGVSQGTLTDFAMRNALVDLSKLNGFEEEASRFFPSAITGATYLDGVYGLPETQTFLMLFCRNDILNDLGLSVPKTWDDVKELIPVLQRNNYAFCMPKSEFLASLVFQYGGNFYLGEGNDYGIRSGLASEEAMQAFKDLTDYFTAYKQPVTIDFNSRFRTGECPVGIVNYTTFCSLEIYAPEIKGLWSFYPIPGVLKEDGTIDNTYVTDSGDCVIMKNCKDLDASWEFTKWWTGTEAQLTYANTIEAVMGSSARYPAADKKVLEQLPWSSFEYNQLVSQLEHTVGIPAIPGNYMTTRMISYSFDDVVANSSNPRETLYLNMKAINKELIKKRNEFNLNTEWNK